MSATPSRRPSALSQSHPQSAQSRRRNATHTSVSRATPLPEYEAPEAPLTVESQRQIAALLASQHLRTLRTHLQHAAEKLTHSGGEINERLCDARTRYEKMKEARRREGDENVDDDEANEEYQRLAEEEARVNAITAKMEEKTRLIVDSEIKLQGLTDAMGQIEREEGETVAAALGVRQTRQQRARQRANAAADDDDEGPEDPTDGDYEDEQEKEMRERNAQNPPSRKLVDKLTEGVQKWDELSLTERYASNNSYIGFYRMVHDSKFPSDDVPPLPHSSTWFDHMEDTNTRSGASARTRNQRRASPAGSDDDVAIERERISLKCPLTLTPYQDPVTSTKCPHSFEREAIMDMINRSPTTIAPPASRRGQRRVHVVKCPVCSIPLTADDLRPDPVLLRRVRRAQELQEREEEDDHLEGDGRKQKDRSTGITLGSDVESDDDAMDVDAHPPSQRIKMEPLSQAARAAQSDDDSSEDVESEDAELEDAENMENAEGEGEEGGDEEGEDEEEEEEEQNGEGENDEVEIEQEPSEEMEVEEPDNEEEEHHDMEIDEPDNEPAENEVEIEEPEDEEVEIEQGQDDEEQSEEVETDQSENEADQNGEVDEEVLINGRQNEEEQDEEVQTEERQSEEENEDVRQADAQSEKGQDEDKSEDSDSEGTEDGEDSEDSDSDIEPKIESGSDEEVEEESQESD
ncbi:Zinc finger, RING/FYVE/PHD-type [Penicillium italicum]|uniref:Zinc finger, RING/FYVE/PHD-type n=1 Tax=Penicillium italicum TaxID=40296 RepID=A0A0A2KXX0_PENIT|nr:Zinc finger, RING/FYVE/PHD-type [Penicillium italicum]